jgi:AbrB family looped-hinge helix DNA binding protein
MSYDADATLTPEGCVTIPDGIRERLGIKPGDRLRFHLADSEQLSITPIR